MTIRSDHPLLQGEITHLKNWQEWRALWDANPSIDVRHGLLHIGFQVPHSQRERDHRTGQIIPFKYSEDRLGFYLAVADGWTDYNHFHSSDLRESYGERRHEEGFFNLTTSRKRQRLAGKAFAVLMNTWLEPFDEKRAEKDYGYRNRVLPWQNFSGHDVCAVLRFFRIYQRYSPYMGYESRFVNLPEDYLWRTSHLPPEVRPHLKERVKEFLTQFILFLWKEYKPRFVWVSEKEPYGEEERREIEQGRNFNQQEKLFAANLPHHRYLFARMLIELHQGQVLKILQSLEPLDERLLRALQRFSLRAKSSTASYDPIKDEVLEMERRVFSLAEVLIASRSSSRTTIAKFLLLRNAKMQAEEQAAKLNQPAHGAQKAERSRRAEGARRQRADELRREAEKLERGQ